MAGREEVFDMARDRRPANAKGAFHAGAHATYRRPRLRHRLNTQERMLLIVEITSYREF